MFDLLKFKINHIICTFFIIYPIVFIDYFMGHIYLKISMKVGR